MPTALRVGPYRFFFYSRDCEEPRHVHVQRDRDVAKFWLEPVRLERSGGFRASELRKVERLTDEHRTELIEKWDEHCH